MDTEDDQRCPDCGFLACICFDDEYREEDDDLADQCGKLADGTCMLAGTEFCDWDCPIGC